MMDFLFGAVLSLCQHVRVPQCGIRATEDPHSFRSKSVEIPDRRTLTDRPHKRTSTYLGPAGGFGSFRQPERLEGKGRSSEHHG